MRHANAFALTPAARQAIRSFRDAKPWKGSVEERAAKFADLHRSLCRAYDLETMLVRDDSGDHEHTGTSARSYFDPHKNHIVQRGRLSVVTYLFLFGGAAGMTPRSALRFAHDTFRHFFPRSFAGCRAVNGLLVRD